MRLRGAEGQWTHNVKIDLFPKFLHLQVIESINKFY